jgi:NADH pyrophosphatase NudC (nudix superfamily)
MTYIIGIEECCPGMKTMVEHRSIKPNATLGSNTAQIFVRGSNNLLHDYDQIKFCPFCGNKIKIIDA